MVGRYSDSTVKPAGKQTWVSGGKRKGSGLQPGASTPHRSLLLPSNWRLSRDVAALPSQEGRVWACSHMGS